MLNLFTLYILQQLVHRDGDLLYLSRYLPFSNSKDGILVLGACAACAPSHVIEGDESQKWLNTEQGYEASQHCALNLISSLQSYLSTHITIHNSTSGHRWSKL